MADKLTPEERAALYSPQLDDKFERTRLNGEDFDRYIIPAEEIVKIMKGEYWDIEGWEMFNNSKIIVLPDNFILNAIVELKKNDVFPKTILINGGIFKDRFIIEGGNFEGLIINKGKFNNGFSIKDGYFNYDFRIGGGEFYGFNIHGGLFNYETQIDGGVFKSRFTINGGVFNGAFTIYEGEFQDDFFIRDAIFNDLFHIWGGEFSEIFRIRKAEFNEEFLLHGGLFNKGFSTSDTIFNRDFSIGKEAQIFNQGRSFYKKVSGIDCSYTSFNRFCLDNKDCKEVKVTACNVNEIKVTNCSLLYIESKVEDQTNIGSLYLQNIVLNNENICNIEDCIIGKINISGLYNTNGSINFNGVTLSKNNVYAVDPELVIEYSDIGNTQFIDCDFKEANFNFRSSKITDAFIEGGAFVGDITTKKIDLLNKIEVEEEDDDGFDNEENTLGERPESEVALNDGDRVSPRDIKARMAKPTTNEPDYEQHRFGYSQLKSIYEKQGDTVRSTFYYNKEMEAYRKTIPTFKKSFEYVFKFENTEVPSLWRRFLKITPEISERFMLVLNRYSNKNVTSWQRGLLFTLVGIVFFYTLYVLSMGYYYWPPTGKSIGYIAENIFAFAQPWHDFDISDGKGLRGKPPYPWLSKLIDFVARIYIIYGSYQTVAAFRRHGKQG